MPLKPKSWRTWIAGIMAFAIFLLISSWELHHLNLLGCLAMTAFFVPMYYCSKMALKIEALWMRAAIIWLIFAASSLLFNGLLFHKLDISQAIFASTYIVINLEYRRRKPTTLPTRMSTYLAQLWAVFRPEDKSKKADY